MVKIFEWGSIDNINKCVFMQQIQITNQEVTFIFSDYIREHIKPISNALIIKDFELIQSFRSEYARQLYKHLMMWDEKQTLYLSIKDFKEFLGVPKTKSYEQMTNLKNKVLNVALKEINEKCPGMDLRYANKTAKGSRKIEGFYFSWFKRDTQKKQQEKQQQTLADTELDEDLQKYINKVLYINGFDFKIISISKKNNKYSIYCHEVDDVNYKKTFEISEAQLKVAK